MLRVDLLESGGRDSLIGVPINQLENNTILITGASGIIGTHFLYALNYIQKDLGIKVKVFAIVNRGVPEHLAILSNNNSINF